MYAQIAAETCGPGLGHENYAWMWINRLVKSLQIFIMIGPAGDNYFVQSTAAGLLGEGASLVGLSSTAKEVTSCAYPSGVPRLLRPKTS